MLYTSTLLRWLQRKRYQYEVTFSLYMLTPTEKFIFSRVLLLLPLQPDSQHASYPKEAFTDICNLNRFIPLPFPLHDHHRGFTLSP